MFVKFFPVNLENILCDAYDGCLCILYAVPVTLSIRIAQTLFEKVTLPYLHKEAAEQYIQNLEMQKTHGIANPYASLALTGFVFPLLEEYFYRGFMTPLIQNLLSILNVDPSYAPILSSMIFAGMHYTGKIEQFYLGLQFEKLVKTHDGSLWASYIAHAFNNVLANICASSAEHTNKQLEEKIQAIRSANVYLKNETMNELQKKIKVINEHWHRTTQPRIPLLKPTTPV